MGGSFDEFATLLKAQQASGGAGGGLAEIVTQADSMFGWGFLNPMSNSSACLPPLCHPPCDVPNCML